MKTIIILSIISGAFIVSSASGEEPVHFRDAILKAAVEDALWISDPTPTDMLGLTDFVCTNTINNGVKDLTGLEYAANLQTLLLSYNQISDLSPLAGLDHLQTLVLNDNQISNISALAGLSQLRHLNIHRNQISEISALAGLGNLQVLSLYLNRVSDISALAGLKGLQSLDLQQNAISDISVLAGLSQLQTLSLRQNHISDISALAGLTGLHNLDLNYNRLNNDSYCTYLQTLVANNRGMNLSYNPNRNPPTGVSASADPYEGTVQVIWNEVCNGPNYTSYYRVSRGTSEDGAKIPISAWQTSSSFEDVTAQPETSYIYWVQTATSSQGLDAGDYSSPKKDWSGKHALRISCTPGGSVTFPGQDLYLYGFGVMVPIQADPVDPDMYVFAGWTGSAVDAGKVADPKRASTTVTVDWDYTLKAHFVSVLTTIYVDDDAPEVPGPEEPSVDDPCENQCENGTPEHPFDSIQEAIEVAANNALIVVLPGTYCENIDLLGKRIHLTGFDPNYPMKRDPYPIIAGNGPGPIVQFASGEYLDCTLTGFVITRAKGPPGCAIYCSRSSPIIGNCLIVGNRSAQPNPAAVYCMESHAVFTHCTIADNDGGQQGAGLYLVDSNVVLTNSIVWGNTPNQILLDGTSEPEITYTDLAGGWTSSSGSGQAGLGTMDEDPLFARPGYWADPNKPYIVFRPSDAKAVWSEGDYHLKSQIGRWDPKIRAWIQDKAISPCIDAGDPASPVGYEPSPNGGVANLGAYGGTAQASKSYFSPTPL